MCLCTTKYIHIYIQNTSIHVHTFWLFNGGEEIKCKCTSPNHNLKDMETRHQNERFRWQFCHCDTQNTFNTTYVFNTEKKQNITSYLNFCSNNHWRFSTGLSQNKFSILKCRMVVLIQKLRRQSRLLNNCVFSTDLLECFLNSPHTPPSPLVKNFILTRMGYTRYCFIHNSELGHHLSEWQSLTR